jgi:hypothetical protein
VRQRPERVDPLTEGNGKSVDDQPLAVALTLDVDPDANRAVPGRPDAVGPDGTARYEACRAGLGLVREAVERRRLPVALFWEGRALHEIARAEPDLVRRFAEDPLAEHGCHGYRHEDFAGAVSGRPMPRDEIDAALDAAEAALQEVLERRPSGFRAPYCRMTDDLATALADRGYGYDASITLDVPADSRLQPYRLPQAPSLRELPLPRARDAGGHPLSGYLWQLCEGKRAVEEYVAMVAGLREPCAGGLLQIALHPWHLLVGEDGQALPDAAGDAAAGRVDALLAELAVLDGVRFSTPSAYLRGWAAHGRGEDGP